MPRSDASIVFSTTLDNKDLEAKLKEAQADIERLEKELEDANKEKLDLAQQLMDADKACKEVEASIESLKERIKELNEAEAMGEITPEEAKGRISAVNAELEQQQAKYDAMVDSNYKLAQSYRNSEQRVNDLNGKLETARKKSASLGREYASTYRTSTAEMSNAFVAMDKQFTGIANKINKRLKKLFMFSFIFGALAALKSYLVSAVQESERFKASVDNMHAVLKGIAAPIINALIPVLTGLVTIITKVLLTFARMVDMIFQTNIMASIQAAQQAAQASTADADATDRQADATNRLAKAKKAALRWMAAFDELNVMDAKDQDDVSDGLNDYADGIAAAQPVDWGAFDVGKIDAELAKIMFILGAALLAVGAILCFSGINIPLGITLMAIGALMIYSVVSENWELLPQEVRDALTKMLVIVGSFLIVIGVILCLTGNIPLGVGLIAAGAALLVTAVAINWDAISQNVDGALRNLLFIVSGLLAVIGVIMIIFGHPVIGIAMIIAGIAIFALTMMTSDEDLPEKVKSALTNLVDIISPLLAVIGVILCIMGHIPLGIALIIAGIAIFAIKQVATDENASETTVREKLSKLLDIISPSMIVLGTILCIFGIFPAGIAMILGGIAALAVKVLVVDEDAGNRTIEEKLAELLDTIGGYLIVIGVILCVFGQFPLGISAIVAGFAALAISATVSGEDIVDKIKGKIDEIFNFIKENAYAVLVLGIVALVLGHPIIAVACLAVGVWALVSPETLDTDWIVNKVQEIWESVKQFWNDNIAPIFTVEWWEDKFKSIANGLIGALNGALRGAGDFINSLTSGFSDVLNWLGVGGWSFSIDMYQIPYLAQGAVIPPNREFMAVLGDQSSGMNIETPEALMRQIVREETGNSYDATMVSLLSQILSAVQNGQVIECDGYTLARVVNSQNQTNSRMYGV